MRTALLVDALLPVLAVLALVEWLVLRRRGTYDWRESLASVGVAAGHSFSGALALLALRPLFAMLWAHRLWTVPMDRAWACALLFLGVELAYYAQHRLSHRVRWLWASHAVHHTSEQLTVSAAYRLAWTDLLSGIPLFVAPLVLAGFAPGAVLGAVAVVVVYQFWLHTEIVPPLGWFDRVFNSPSNHRVHHAIGARGEGRNFGGVLVVFDRLFGTYEAERVGAPVRYGRSPPLRSYSPVVVALHEWAALWRDVRGSRGWAGAFAACLHRPQEHRVVPRAPAQRGPRPPSFAR